LLPHELHSWIRPDGSIGEGVFTIDEPLIVPPRYVLRGLGMERTVIVARDKTRPAIELSGGLGGVQVLGGSIGVNVRDESRGAILWDCMIAESGLIPLWIGRCVGARVSRVLVTDAPDNGIQLEGPMDCELHSCAVIGNFGNKAIDMTHGNPRQVRLVHVTVVALSGYGVGCAGWAAGSDNLLLNCAIFAPPPGPGASGFGVHLPQGLASGSFAGNVVQGGVVGAPSQAPGFDQTGNLGEDLAGWAGTPLSPVERIRPTTSPRMWRASLRTTLTRDLEGVYRAPWRGRLVSGAVARPPGRSRLVRVPDAPAGR
jgi:hypothetical protein